MLSRFLLGVLLWAAAILTADAQSLPVPSTRTNQANSILVIESIDSKGHFKGTYENKAVGSPCEDIFDMKGTDIGNRVNFVVVWKNAVVECGSITAWKGVISSTQINSDWELAHGSEDTGEIVTQTGSDTFARQKHDCPRP
jgi:Avidin family